MLQQPHTYVHTHTVFNFVVCVSNSGYLSLVDEGTAITLIIQQVFRSKQMCVGAVNFMRKDLIREYLRNSIVKKESLIDFHPKYVILT